jgi:hypothetical protein
MMSAVAANGAGRREHREEMRAGLGGRPGGTKAARHRLAPVISEPCAASLSWKILQSRKAFRAIAQCRLPYSPHWYRV